MSQNIENLKQKFSLPLGTVFSHEMIEVVKKHNSNTKYGECLKCVFISNTEFCNECLVCQINNKLGDYFEQVT